MTIGGDAGSSRLQIAFEGDALDPASWSGTPAGIAAALGGLGLAVDAVDVTPVLFRSRAGRALAAAVQVPAALRRRDVRAADVRPVAAWLANSTAASACRRSMMYDARAQQLPPAVGVIRMRGQFSVDTGTPSIVLDDLTLAQAFAVDWRGLGAAPSRLRASALRVQRRAYHQAVACCAASRWTARSLVQDFGLPPERVHVVGCGVPGPTRQVDRQWTAPRYLFISMDWARKNGDAVVSAFRRIRQELPSACLDLVGDHPRVDEDGVRLHGVLPKGRPDAQRQLSRLTQEATCLVMPSTIEPFGIAYVEAGAVGVPSIGTTVGGAEDAVGPGGVLVNPDRPDQLLAAMRRLSDPTAARGYGDAARRHAARCTWPVIAQRLVRHLLPGRFSDVDDLTPLSPS